MYEIKACVGISEVGQLLDLKYDIKFYRSDPHELILLQNSGNQLHFLDQSSMIYRAGRPICSKVLKIMFWEVPPADWLTL